MLEQVLSKKLTADDTVSASPGKIWAARLISDGTNAGSVAFRDGGATGAIIWEMNVTSTAGDTEFVQFPHGLSYETDLYADVTTIGSLWVAYT